MVDVDVESRPAAVRTLHLEDPVKPSFHRVSGVLEFFEIEALKGNEDLCGVIDVGIELVFELEVPAARVEVRSTYLPVARAAHFLGDEPATRIQ